jgi:hypothetical protein
MKKTAIEKKRESPVDESLRRRVSPLVTVLSVRIRQASGGGRRFEVTQNRYRLWITLENTARKYRDVLFILKCILYSG